MYCLKCGNLLKKEDNFCSICGTPNSAEAKRMSQGISGYAPIRDDEPINLDDFFKADEKTERTLAKIDRELDEIKAKATESLLRRKAGDASTRRAARLAKRAASGAGGRRDKQTYEADTDFDFNDDVFQTNVEREALIGRRGQLKGKIDMEPEPTFDFRSKEAEDIKRETTAYWQEHGMNEPEEPVRLEPEGKVVLSEPIQSPVQKPAKPKRHHLFREDTIEMPNIFDEIAESMEKSRQQEHGYIMSEAKEAEVDDDVPLTWRTTPKGEGFAEGVFPLPPKEGFAEGVFPLPPKEDFTEGVFPLPPKEDFAEGVFPLPPKEDFTEGVFALPPKEDFTEGAFALPPKEDFTEGIFPLPADAKTNEEAEPVLPSDMTALQNADATDEPAGEVSQIHSWDIEGDEEQEKISYALRRPSRAQGANSLKNTDEPEYEYFRYRSKKKKGPNPALIIVAVLIIIIAAVGTKMLYDGETPASVFHQLQEVFAQNSGTIEDEGAETLAGVDDDIQNTDDAESSTSGELPDISELKEQGTSDPAKMIQYVLSKGINKNVKAVEYNPDLKYEAGAEYQSDDITNAKPITENLFYEKNGEKYYYTESIISTMVQYNSQWVDYFNDQNKAVLNLIKKGSKAYQHAIAFSSDGAREECILLEIGEMRKGKDGYYVWTKEVYNVAKGSASKLEESQWIYYLEPSGENMKIVNYYY